MHWVLECKTKAKEFSLFKHKPTLLLTYFMIRDILAVFFGMMLYKHIPIIVIWIYNRIDFWLFKKWVVDGEYYYYCICLLHLKQYRQNAYGGCYVPFFAKSIWVTKRKKVC